MGVIHICLNKYEDNVIRLFTIGEERGYEECKHPKTVQSKKLNWMELNILSIFCSQMYNENCNINGHLLHL